MIKNLQCIACKSTWKLLCHKFHSCLKCYNLLRIPQLKQIVSSKSVPKHQPAKTNAWSFLAWQQKNYLSKYWIIEVLLLSIGKPEVILLFLHSPHPFTCTSNCVWDQQNHNHTHLPVCPFVEQWLHKLQMPQHPSPVCSGPHPWYPSQMAILDYNRTLHSLQENRPKEKKTPELVMQISNLQASKQTCYTVVNLKAASLRTSESTSTWKHICCAVPNLWEGFRV